MIGFQASDIGQYGIENLDWWSNPSGLGIFANSWDFGFGGQSPFDFSLGGVIESVVGSVLPNPPTGYVPPVVIGEIPQSVISPQDTGRGQIPSKVNLPGETESEALEELLEERRRLEAIVAAQPPPGKLEPIDESVWGPVIKTQVPVPVEVDDSEFEEGEEMAHTWLHAGTEILTSVFQPSPQVYDTGTSFAPWTTPTTTPARIIDPRSGQVRCKRRRRRRALLTQSDLNVLNQIANLPNNSNVRTALAKAVR